LLLFLVSANLKFLQGSSAHSTQLVMGGLSLVKAKLEYALAPADGWIIQNPDRSAGAGF
jgi:hypothetical protein